MKRRKLTPAQENELCKEYLDGIDCIDLAGIYDISTFTVYRILQRNGIKLREPSRKKRNYNLNTSDDPYLDLANAIIVQACEDWKNNIRRPEVEKFLLSDYGDIITRGNGEYILEQLRKEYEQ